MSYRHLTPVVPLEYNEKEYQKTQTVSHKLRLVPSDVDSLTYEYRAVLFSNGDPQEYIECIHRMNKVFTGLDMTKKPVQKFAIAATLFQGQAERAFTAYVNQNAKTDKDKTDANFKKALEAVAKTVFPTCLLYTSDAADE